MPDRPNSRYGWAGRYRWKHTDIYPSVHAGNVAQYAGMYPMPALDYIEREEQDGMEYICNSIFDKREFRDLTIQQVLDAVGYYLLVVGPRENAPPFVADPDGDEAFSPSVQEQLAEISPRNITYG
jgi:hypothetical protein